jgi:GGDEF domain-containing protein
MEISPLVQVAALDAPGRLEALARTELMDTASEAAFDRLSRLAARVLATPAACLTLVDDRRAFVKSAEGVAARWRGRSLSVLSHALAPAVVCTGAPLIVGDVASTPGWATHPAVRALRIAAYAGVPVSAPGGHLLGALAVADTEPRRWHDVDVAWLEELAAIAHAELALRASLVADPLAGLVTAAQFETALAGRLAAAELRGEPCSLVRLALRTRPGRTTLSLGEATRGLQAAAGAETLIAHTGDESFVLLPASALEAAPARRLALELARALTVASPPPDSTPAVTVHAGVATSRRDERPSPTSMLAAAQRALRPLAPRRRTPRR